MEGKRRDVLAGARRVFGRDGYTRATIAAIAAEAGVSTRTIYNHWADKAALFADVIRWSSGQVAAAQLALLDRHLRKVVDLEDDLVDFAVDWLASRDEFGEHFALVRQVAAEADHVPPDARRAWQAAGPKRVLAGVATVLCGVAERGLVRIGDPDRAARQLAALVGVAADADPGLRRALVRSGVRLFLAGVPASDP